MSIPNWWGDWRQGLTPHTGNLQSTDLIECTQIVAGQPVNTVITGQQIINAAPGGSPAWGSITGILSSQTDLQTALNAKQDTLVSGTNIKTINGASVLGSGNLTVTGSSNPTTISSVDGTGISGLVNAISATVLIPANTIISTNTIYIKAYIDRTVVSGSGATILRFYTNTSNSLTGATYLGSGAAMATTVRFQRFERNIFFDGTNLNCFLTGTSSATDYTASGISLIPFNSTINNYLIFAVQHSTSATDIAAWKKVIVQNYV
jgi:hypothetical protein